MGIESSAANRQHRGPGLDESSADVRRYMAAISRSRWLILLTVLIISGTVLALSLALPKTYQSVARISLDEQASAFGTLDAESTQRRLATLDSLLTSREVLAPAARQVPGETAASLEESIESSVDQEANIINIVASDQNPQRSALMAQSVADTFLEVQATRERQRLERARDDLAAQVARIPRTRETRVQIAAIQDRLSQVSIDLQLAGSELQIAQAAEPPRSPATPRPVRNTILAFFGALFLGVLLALARDQLRPGLRGPREFSRLAGGLPVLASIPYVRRGLLRRKRLARTTAAEHEAYQTLRGAIRLAAPPGDGTHVILVTSALHGEGKTTVTARLGRALAQGGNRVLIVAADLRVPTINRLFGVPLSPGLSEAITFTERARDSHLVLPATVRHLGPGEQNGATGYQLDLLTSGQEPEDPSRLLSSDAADRLFTHAREQGYDYVLIDSPPLLGIADVQALAPYADDVLMVGRLDILTPDGVIDVQDIFARLQIKPMGLVVIGAKSEASPYHYMQRPPTRSRGGEPMSERVP